MSDRFLIDTSAWLFTLGPDPVPEIRERVSGLVEKGLTATSWPIFFELASFPAEESVRRALDEDIRALPMVPFEEADWREAAGWTAGLRRHGSKIRSMDALVAFIARKHKLTLLHADADMDKLARRTPLKVESHVESARRWSKRH